MSALLPFALVLIAVATGLRRTTGSGRLLVLRLGSISRLAGPGVSYIVPIVERNVRVDLDEVAADWRALSEEELLQCVITYVSQPAPPPVGWSGNVPRTERWIRSFSAYAILLVLALGFAAVLGFATTVASGWLEGSLPANLSDLLGTQLSRQSIVLMLFGFSVGAVIGWHIAASLIRSLDLVPERVIQQLLHGAQHTPDDENAAK